MNGLRPARYWRTAASAGLLIEKARQRVPGAEKLIFDTRVVVPEPVIVDQVDHDKGAAQGGKGRKNIVLADHGILKGKDAGNKTDFIEAQKTEI